MSNSLILVLVLVGFLGVTFGDLPGDGDNAGSTTPKPVPNNRAIIDHGPPGKGATGRYKTAQPRRVTVIPVTGETKPSADKPSEIVPSKVEPEVKNNETKPSNRAHVGGFGLPATGRPKSLLNCQIACPEGWVKFGTFPNCYKLPAQPAYLDTFWEHQRLCKKIEPTSYVAVMNGLAEQAFATPVAHQYAANWFAVGTNGFMWLGGYTDNKESWRFLDGSNEKGNLLMTAANLIGSKKNGTCLGADPKTLGLWQTRPCSDKTGAAICEMAPRRVCGKTGTIIPIAPIDLTQLKNLFPKLYSIPFIGTEYTNAFKGFKGLNLGG